MEATLKATSVVLKNELPHYEADGIKIRTNKPATKPMKIKIIKILKWLSLGYLFLCFLSLSAYLIYLIVDPPTLREAGHLHHGCYLRSSLFVDCQGLPASALGLPENVFIELALNFWFLPAIGILFLIGFPYAVLSGEYGYPVFSLREPQYSLISLMIISYILIVLSPIVYLLWYGLKGRRLT
jgi:hypothetical protein